jgi:hypothetical protein
MGIDHCQSFSILRLTSYSLCILRMFKSHPHFNGIESMGIDHCQSLSILRLISHSLYILSMFKSHPHYNGIQFVIFSDALGYAKPQNNYPLVMGINYKLIGKNNYILKTINKR